MKVNAMNVNQEKQHNCFRNPCFFIRVLYLKCWQLKSLTSLNSPPIFGNREGTRMDTKRGKLGSREDKKPGSSVPWVCCLLRAKSQELRAKIICGFIFLYTRGAPYLRAKSQELTAKSRFLAAGGKRTIKMPILRKFCDLIGRNLSSIG